MELKNALANCKKYLISSNCEKIDPESLMKLISIAEMVESVGGVEDKELPKKCSQMKATGVDYIIIPLESEIIEMLNNRNHLWRALIVGKLEKVEEIIKKYHCHFCKEKCSGLMNEEYCMRKAATAIRELFIGGDKCI